MINQPIRPQLSFKKNLLRVSGYHFEIINTVDKNNKLIKLGKISLDRISVQCSN